MKTKCPVCKREIYWKSNEFRPFCSQRCKIIDLGNWADEKYSIPVENDPEKKEEDN